MNYTIYYFSGTGNTKLIAAEIVKAIDNKKKAEVKDTKWDFISNHGLVLIYISKHPRSTAREIAAAVNVTEWTVHKIISELEKDGFVKKKKEGRSNAYHVNKNNTLRHNIIDHVSVRDFLSLLA